MKYACLLICLSCSGQQINPESCSKARLEEITAWYQANLAAKCFGEDERCAEKPSLDQELHDRLKQWVRCETEKGQ